jgi:hypothetical protein
LTKKYKKGGYKAMKEKINLAKLSENELNAVKAGLESVEPGCLDGVCCTGCSGGDPAARCCACKK